jgi:hypothetical protein
MTTDELRDAVWDNLFRIKSSKSIDEIATETNCSPYDVRHALNHEWFNIAGDTVSIAYTAPRQGVT